MLIFFGFLIFSPIAFVIFIILLLLLIKIITNPKLNTNWIELHKNLAEIDLRDDSQVLIKNIINASYNPNFEFEYKLESLNKKYNLNDLKTVWFFENNYAPFQSHIMISFEFLGGAFLTISPEVRKASLEDFEVWHVFTKNFSIFYRFTTEQDAIYLRTNIRKSPVKMFQLNLTEAQTKNLFISICNTANNMFKKDLIYKLFTTDCVNELLKEFRKSNILVKKYFWDWSPTKVLQRSDLIKGQIILLNDKTKFLKPDEDFPFAIRK